MSNPKHNEIVALALNCGFTQVSPFSVQALNPLVEVREMCQHNLCQSYGKNWQCPPALPALEFCKKELQKYAQAFLLMLCGDIEDSFDYEAIQAIQKKHNKCMLALQEQKADYFPNALLLGAGACTICKHCSYPDAACRHPKKSIASLEAYGLLVSDLCKSAELPYYQGQQKISFFGALLI